MYKIKIVREKSILMYYVCIYMNSENTITKLKSQKLKNVLPQIELEDKIM